MRIEIRVVAFVLLFCGNVFAGDELKCPKGQIVDPCGTSSCPQCDDCVPACVPDSGQQKRAKPPEGGYASCEECARACVPDKKAKVKGAKRR